jgi:hypothetical protein
MLTFIPITTFQIKKYFLNYKQTLKIYNEKKNKF